MVCVFSWDDGRSPLRLEKRLRLRDNNISRYAAEFQEICEIGSGEFAQVYKCRNRLDGCVYALKRSTNPVADELAAFREVCAHAVLGSHSHIVRYYSAWAECDRMIIQNEFCNGGSLASAIADRKSHQKTFAEIEMKQLLFQIAQVCGTHSLSSECTVQYWCAGTQTYPFNELSTPGCETRQYIYKLH
eukprot:m.60071 g.60071  ORF g.60071 m.60071 type:complete len:188 (+) comp34912_c0_seq1:735-1298(+)